MPLIELPNGDWLRHDTVAKISVVTHNQAAGPVVHVYELGGRLTVIQFDDPEAARGWAREFAEACNVGLSAAPPSVDLAAAQRALNASRRA